MRSIIVFTGIFFCFFCWGVAQTKVQAKDVPESVLTGFSQRFPGTPVDSWLSEDGKYKAVCKPEGQKTIVVFAADGSYLSSRLQMKKSKVPIIVVAGLKSSEHHAWKVLSVEYVEAASGQNYYEFHLSHHKKKESLAFDDRGNPITEK